MTIRVLTHYLKSDPQFQGDYVSVEIFANGLKLKSYGDYYHDKGTEKVAGFLDALRLFEDIGTVVYEHAADADE